MAGDDAARDPTETGRLSSERIDELLANRHRRVALCHLYASPNPVSLPEIADEVTRLEYRDPVEERLDERLHIYMSLYHDHVPTLEAAGLVEYDQAADTVELTERAAAVEPRVERVARDVLDEIRDS
jgi:hypothetical protein